MKILKIENENGFFRLGEDAEWQPIDTIDKNALLQLLELYLSMEVQMDSPHEQSVNNQAHSIIYGGIFEKLSQLADEKSRFKDESETLYLEEMNKYAAQ